MLIRLRRLPRVRRGQSSLQIGTSAGVATLVEGVTAADTVWLSRLSVGVQADRLTEALATDPRTRELIDLLTRHGLLEALPARHRESAGDLSAFMSAIPDTIPLPPDPDTDSLAWGILGAADGVALVRARRARRVHVTGEGRVSVVTRALLRCAGVGVALPAPSRRPPPTEDADLVVLVSTAVADASLGAPLVAADTAHLSVVLRETDAIVGPLVIPGQTACLTCIDLHRFDEDEHWPDVVGQLLARPSGDAPAESSLVALVAGAVVGRVLAHLDDIVLDPHRDGATPGDAEPTAAVTTRLHPGALVTATRRWAPHPECGCCAGLIGAPADRRGERDVERDRVPAGRIGT